MTSRRVPDRVKEVAREDFDQAKTLAHDAVRSGAYLYPFKGILYFFSHRSLWRPLASKLVPTMSLGLGITALMFAFTYVPQAAILSLFNGPLAVLTTVLLVLSESSTVFNVLSKGFLLEDALVDTFDGTLMSRNMTTLVSNERQVKSGNDPISKLGKLVRRPFANFTPSAIIRYFMYLPLNFIPVVGTVMFIILQGRKFGPTAHERYFQLKQMRRREKEEFIERHKAAYASFGIPAVLLELIPVAGILLTFTNTVGAALWAADMEEAGEGGQKTTAPNLRNQIEMARNNIENLLNYTDEKFLSPVKASYGQAGWAWANPLFQKNSEAAKGAERKMNVMALDNAVSDKQEKETEVQMESSESLGHGMA